MPCSVLFTTIGVATSVWLDLFLLSLIVERKEDGYRECGTVVGVGGEGEGFASSMSEAVTLMLRLLAAVRAVVGLPLSLSLLKISALFVEGRGGLERSHCSRVCPSRVVFLLLSFYNISLVPARKDVL
ncbi:unnamed protein product [Ectocarpus sp. 12 AP-2014]